jgi:hypothetical protein
MARLNSPTCPTALDTRGALLACGRSEWPVDNRKWVFLRSTVDRALWYPQRGGQSAVGGENVPELSACVLRVWQAPLGLDPTPSSFSSSAVLDHLQAPRHNHTLSQNRTERTQIRIQMQCVARAAQCNASPISASSPPTSSLDAMTMTRGQVFAVVLLALQGCVADPAPTATVTMTTPKMIDPSFTRSCTCPIGNSSACIAPSAIKSCGHRRSLELRPAGLRSPSTC